MQKFSTIVRRQSRTGPSQNTTHGLLSNALRRFLLPASVGIAACGSVGCNGVQVSDRDLKSISTVELSSLVEAAKEEPDTVVLIDSRSPIDFRRSHLPKAVNVDLADMDGGAFSDAKFAAFETRVVYGRDPGSAIARALAKRLLAMGYDKVRLYQPGIEGWARAGLALESDEPASTSEGGN
jgi:rhodanese-related sulfurtransferase